MAMVDQGALAPLRDLADVRRLEADGLPADLPSSTYELIAQAAAAFGEAPAISFFISVDHHRRPRRWSYKALFAEVTRAANIFHGLGVGPEDAVAYLLPNLPETHFALWGAEAAGVAVAINPLLEAEAIGRLLKTAGTKVLVTLAPFPGTDLHDKAMAAAALAPSLRHVVLVGMAHHVPGIAGIVARALQWRAGLGAAKAPDGVSVHRYAALAKKAPADRLVSGRQIAPDEASSFFSTGGTTGLPKLARRTHGAEVANAWMSARMGGDVTPQGSLLFCGLPLFHVNAVMATGIAAFLKGAHVLIGTPQGFRGAGVIERFWELVEAHGIAVFAGVPTLYAALLRQPIGGRNVSSLRYAFCGAAPMPADLIGQFETATGIVILEGYGMTEAACVVSLNPVAGARHAGSVGLPLPFQEMTVVIVDAAGHFVRDAVTDEAGVVALAGPNMFSGYLSDAHNRGIWVDRGDGKRWFNTGDLGRMDAEGYVWLTGRAKDLIIRGGHNIDPAVIEEALLAHPGVELAAAIGRPDAHAGEIPVAYVKAGGESELAGEALLAFANARIAERAARLKAVHVLNALPLTAVGKIDKQELRKREMGDLVRELTGAAGIAAEVAVAADERRGLVTTVHVRAGDAAPARLALAGQAFAIDIVEG